jgi:hypothetical protein
LQAGCTSIERACIVDEYAVNIFSVKMNEISCTLIQRLQEYEKSKVPVIDNAFRFAGDGAEV